jgi:hypothetical protein
VPVQVTINDDGSYAILTPDGVTHSVRGHLEKTDNKTTLVSWIDDVKSSVHVFHEGQNLHLFHAKGITCLGKFNDQSDNVKKK